MIRQKNCAVYEVITSRYDTRNNAANTPTFVILRKKQKGVVSIQNKYFSLAFLNKPVQKDFDSYWK